MPLPSSDVSWRKVLTALESEQSARAAARRLDGYRPYPRQRSFHDAGAPHRERLFMAGNQLGKTLAGGMEYAMHLTGRYPDWWRGRRWERPIVGWAAGVTGESTRDNVQRMLLGRPGDWGTGAIPRTAIEDVSRRAHGLTDSVDAIIVRHASGGLSRVQLKSYEQGREKWQGETLDLLWFDEEPPAQIYTEGLTRTNATGGMVFMTFTPLLGLSEVVARFLDAPSPDRHVTRMTIDDAAHYGPDERARIVASYPAHERDARARGEPALGSGRVFPLPEETIRVEAFEPPAHWAELAGIDFGWGHPTAAVKLAWDRETDTAYVTAAYRRREATPLEHAAALKPWGERLPWAWPHDGLQHDKGSGEQLAAQYRRAGLAMLPERATFPDGSSGLEAGVLDMLERLATGRLKVFAHLAEWFEEFRGYHRKEGLIVKERDDLMSATRYALMMLRFAEVRRATAARLEIRRRAIV